MRFKSGRSVFGSDQLWIGFGDDLVERPREAAALAARASAGRCQRSFNSADLADAVGQFSPPRLLADGSAAPGRNLSRTASPTRLPVGSHAKGASRRNRQSTARSFLASAAQCTRRSGTALPSTPSRNTSSLPGPAAVTIPSLSPNFICRAQGSRRKSPAARQAPLACRLASIPANTASARRPPGSR